MILTMTKHSQYGWTAIGAFGLILFCAAGALLAKVFLGEVAHFSATPWILISVQLAPVPLAFYLRTKFSEVRDSKGLSSTERRRLAYIIRGKRRQVAIAMICYLLAAFVSALAFSVGSGDESLSRIALIVSSGFVAGSIFSVFLILSELNEVDEFKQKIQDRSEQHSKQISALKRLRGS